MANLLFHELGFPVLLIDPPMVNIRGQWLPDINLRDLQLVVFRLLVAKPTRLTGDEIRFIRLYLRLRQSDLAKVLNRANHSVVSQWESHGDGASGMDYNTEVLLRIWMAGKSGQAERVAHLLEHELRGLGPISDEALAVCMPLAA